MPEWDNEKRIVLFRCKTPKKNPKGPDLNAAFTLDGVDYRASLWVVTDRDTGKAKLDRNGSKFYAGPIEREAPPQPAPPPTGEAASPAPAPLPQGDGGAGDIF